MSKLYWQVLASRRWKDLKWRRIRFAHFQCEGTCGYEYAGRFSRSAMSAFELHHTNYANVGRETLQDVRILCPTCHAVEHDLIPREVAA